MDGFDNSARRLATVQLRNGSETREKIARLYRTWPSPVTIHLYVVRSIAPIGPRAWSLSVLMPISAPSPYSPPSANRVLALTRTLAESTAATNRSIAGLELLRIASV